MQGNLGFFNSTGDTPISGMLGTDRQFSDFNFVIDPATLPNQIIQVTFGCRLTGTGSITFNVRLGGSWWGANSPGPASDGSTIIGIGGPFTPPGGLGLVEFTTPPFDAGAVLTRLMITYTVVANSLGVQDPFIISVPSV